MRLFIFSPFSFIYQHSYPEHIIAKYLAANHSVAIMRCNGLINHFCTSMEAAGLNVNSSIKQKSTVCKQCKSNTKRFSKNSNYKTCFIEDYLHSDDYRNVDRIVQAQINSNASTENFTFDSIPFGRICSYELILHFKKMSIECNNNDQRQYFYAQLRGALLCYFAMMRHLKEELYTHSLIYSPQYAINHAAATVLERHNIPIYFAEAGTNIAYRLSTMRLWKWNEHRLVNPLISRWNKIKDIKLTENDITKVTDHYKVLTQANSYAVYSQAYKGNTDIRKLWSIPSNKKIVLATMSSYDEAYAAYIAGLFPSSKVVSQVFKNQLEWIDETLKFIADRNNLFLIVRVHPRDFPNKRETKISDQAKTLIDSLHTNFTNSVINWPEDNISIYELYLQSDVVVTGWSVTALEASVVGIPVVTYDKNLPSYPEDVMYTGSSRQEYFDNILAAIQQGGKLNHSSYSLRWMALNHTKGVAEICRRFYLIEKRRTIIERIWDTILKKFLGMDQLGKYLYRNDSNFEQLKLIEKMLLSNAGTVIDVVQFNSANNNLPDDAQIVENGLRKIKALLCNPKGYAHEK